MESWRGGDKTETGMSECHLATISVPSPPFPPVIFPPNQTTSRWPRSEMNLRPWMIYSTLRKSLKQMSVGNNSEEIHLLSNGDLDLQMFSQMGTYCFFFFLFFLHSKIPKQPHCNIKYEYMYFLFCFVLACISTPQLNSMHVETNESVSASHFRKSRTPSTLTPLRVLLAWTWT